VDVDATSIGQQHGAPEEARLRIAERREPPVEEVDGVLPEEAAVMAPL
jgi:hypothetical protein